MTKRSEIVVFTDALSQMRIILIKVFSQVRKIYIRELSQVRRITFIGVLFQKRIISLRELMTSHRCAFTINITETRFSCWLKSIIFGTSFIFNKKYKWLVYRRRKILLNTTKKIAKNFWWEDLVHTIFFLLLFFHILFVLKTV